jgi:hypothetical protein
MPNGDVHWKAGATVGGCYAAYLAWGQATQQVAVETAGGVLGGAIGGLLPDWIDAPTSPRHRAEAHSVAITGISGYYLKEQILPWQSSLRTQAEVYSRTRQQSPEPLAQLWYGFLEFVCRLVAGALAGILGGYASHLALDSLTPACLPILC